MASDLLSEEYAVWLSHLFPSYGRTSLALLSVGVGVGVYALGYVVAAIGSVGYLVDPFPVFAAFGIAWGVASLGWADGTYVDVWNEVRPAFDVDDGTYRSVVGPHLERAHDERRILAYWAALAVPYFVLVAVFFRPDLPLHDPLRRAILGPERVPLSGGIARIAYYYLFGAVGVLVLATAVNGLANHVALVRDVSELPFRNVHTSAAELEPVAWFSMASATTWFAGVTVILLYLRTVGGVDLGAPVLAVLVLAGVVLFLAPQLILHAALLDAKRELLAEVRGEFEAIHRSAQESDPPDDLSLRLEAADRRVESVRAIRTWVYDVSSAGKLLAASVIPWFDLINESLPFLPFG